MMQGITTKYLPATNTKERRIKAVSASGVALVKPWNDDLDIDANHRAVAVALAYQLDWPGTWHGGAIGGGSFAFVANDPSPATVYSAERLRIDCASE